MSPALSASQTVALMDHLVRLSGLRERDPLLQALTQALADVTLASVVTTWSLVVDETDRFWLARTSCSPASGFTVLADPMHVDHAALLPVARSPERLQCIEQGQNVLTRLSLPGVEDWLVRLPVMIGTDPAPWGVVEIRLPVPPGEEVLLAATRLVHVFSNMWGMLDYSERDALTGLWNRKSFDDLFFKTLPAAEPTGPGATVADHREHPTGARFFLAMVDIDHFKQVNDRFGHLIGDEVLLLVAQLLKVAFRVYDRVYRFGGEEFVVVLRCGNHEAAAGALERFRAAMQAYEFPQAGRITVSIGFTEIQAADSPNAACERADQAVYYAKRNGRNQVCSEAELVRLGMLSSSVKVGGVELF